MNTHNFEQGHTPSGHGAATMPFSPVEVEAFRQDDRRAAAAIVGLMAGIFTIGLIGYILVCIWVA